MHRKLPTSLLPCCDKIRQDIHTCLGYYLLANHIVIIAWAAGHAGGFYYNYGGGKGDFLL